MQFKVRLVGSVYVINFAEKKHSCDVFSDVSQFDINQIIKGTIDEGSTLK